MLLQWLGRRHDQAAYLAAGDTIHACVDTILDQPELRTRDVGGKADTDAFTDAVVAAI